MQGLHVVTAPPRPHFQPDSITSFRQMTPYGNRIELFQCHTPPRIDGRRLCRQDRPYRTVRPEGRVPHGKSAPPGTAGVPCFLRSRRQILVLSNFNRGIYACPHFLSTIFLFFATDFTSLPKPGVVERSGPQGDPPECTAVNRSLTDRSPIAGSARSPAAGARPNAPHNYFI